MENEIPLSKLLEELQHHLPNDSPYPQGVSAKEPLKFYEAETSLEILIVRAKEGNGRIPRRLYNEVLGELKKIASDPQFPKNIQLALNELIAHFQKAATLDNNTAVVDVNKIQAILDVLQRA